MILPAPSTADDRRIAPPPELAAAVARVRAGERWDYLLPWAGRLSAADRARLRSDLDLLLREPEEQGEPLDWGELCDALEEYRHLSGADLPLLAAPEPERQEAYTVNIRPRELRALECASRAVRAATNEALERFLPQRPTCGGALRRGRLRKMPDRDVWQLQLPDGYRLRYYVAEPERIVYVVYLGPHPDGAADGRETAVRAGVRRRRHERGSELPR
ncbi:MAG: hypothetical protein ACK47B_06240 [Armatimonadota bacterium]